MSNIVPRNLRVYLLISEFFLSGSATVFDIWARLISYRIIQNESACVHASLYREIKDFLNFPLSRIHIRQIKAVFSAKLSPEWFLNCENFTLRRLYLPVRSATCSRSTNYNLQFYYSVIKMCANPCRIYNFLI